MVWSTRARRASVTFAAVLALLATGVVAGFAVGGTGTVQPPPRIAFLANGVVPADALAAGGVAGRLGAPVFTTPADVLDETAAEGLAAYGPAVVVVLGGEVAITNTVVDAVAEATGLEPVALPETGGVEKGIVRVAGGTRYETAVAIAGLLAAYPAAYLPADGTAVGALDAATADKSLRADTAGDSDRLDGLDSASFLTKAPVEVVANGIWQKLDGCPDAEVTVEPGGEVLTSGADCEAQFTMRLERPTTLGGQDLRLVNVEVCWTADDQVTSLSLYRRTSGPDQLVDADDTLYPPTGCASLNVDPARSDGAFSVVIGFTGTLRPATVTSRLLTA